MVSHLHLKRSPSMKGSAVKLAILPFPQSAETFSPAQPTCSLIIWHILYANTMAGQSHLKWSPSMKGLAFILAIPFQQHETGKVHP